MKFKVFTFILFFLFAFAFPTYAAPVQENPNIGCQIINDTVPSLGCLTIVIANIISLAFMLVAAVGLIFMMVGAIQVIIARGDPKAIEKGKKTFTFAIIGIVVALLMFIASGVIASLLGIPNPLLNFSLYVP